MSATPISLVVGLGNPGPEYAATRHNIGFMVLAACRQRWRLTGPPQHAHESHYWSCRRGGRQLYLQQPLTFMNLSGTAVAPLARRLQLTPAEILVVYDDLDLPLGRLRLRPEGSSGGHRGTESLITELGAANFARLRVGIGRGAEAQEVVDFVLSKFGPAEEPLLARVVAAAATAVEVACRRGLTVAMNTYNAQLISRDDTALPEERRS